MQLLVFWLISSAFFAQSYAVSFRIGPLRRVSAFIQQVTSKSKSNKPGGFQINELGGKDIEDSKHPLFEVMTEIKTNLAQLREKPNSELQLDVQTNEYLDKITEYYYQEFLNMCAQYTHRRQYSPLRDVILSECTEVCKEVTSHMDLSYEVN